MKVSSKAIVASLESIFKNFPLQKMELAYSIVDIEKHLIVKDKLAYFDDYTENEILGKLIPNLTKKSCIYRYTSLGNCLKILESGILELNGINSMNDKSEVNYFKSNLSKDVSMTYENIDPKTIAAGNRRFISSFSNRKDDLSLWRMYTNDASGVCLEFEIDKAFKNDNYIISIKPVIYGTKSNSFKFLKKLMSCKLEDQNQRFVFRQMHLLQNFFKSSQFKDEDEIRLFCYIKDDFEKIKWRIANKSEIIYPYIEFYLSKNELPIKLKKIILGPKLPEQKINYIQLKAYLKKISTLKERLWLSDVKIEKSTINNYR